MKRKLTILMFSLLLAVGWTNVASAQSYTLKASDMAGWTYKWLPQNATDSVESYYVEINPETGKYEAPEVTDPYQIYGLLRKVYMDTRLPGPYQSAYTYNNVREDDTYYGGIGGGWNIPGGTASAVGNITIQFASYSIVFSSITVTGNNLSTPLTWTYADNGASLPAGWSANANLVDENALGGCSIGDGNGGTITIPASLLNGSGQVTVTIRSRRYSNQSSTSNCNITITGATQATKNVTSTTYNNYSWTVNGTTTNDRNFYHPQNEGYTALIVSLVNNYQIYPEPTALAGSCEFTNTEDLIAYIAQNFKSVRLLTDGLRIGSGEDVGTVFNCSGTYNKFFFIGKGQARKKDPAVETNITNNTWASYCGETVPFKFMFEQFSPTTGDEGSDINDFYIEMMDGAVYDVVHDCASVIQLEHQFSMSGKTGTQAYAMSGMNFFIPDYRLKYWNNTNFYYRTTSNGQTTSHGPYSVDGRDMNPFHYGDETHKLTTTFRDVTYWQAEYGNYNPQHAPKVGLYTITLDANAQPCEGYQNPGNTKYTVTLDWTSSLNEMSGDTVPQMYIIYEVVTDSLGAESLEVVDTVYTSTTYDFNGKLWPQGEHSESHTYIIMGSPTDNDHPSFVAWSNEDDIIIPGLNDFLMLNLDHYESDFDVPNVQNWYRNFLTVNNDSYKGLTTRGIFEGDSVFNLMRYENLDSMITKQVAKIKFANQNNGTVKYTINYVDANGVNTQDIEDYDIVKPDIWNENHTEIIRPAFTIPDAYELSTMGIPTEGYLNIKTDRDIIIKPNGYGISFNQITLKVNGTTKDTWRASSGTTWPTGWSAQGKWTKDDGDDYYYMDGNGTGYILISGTAVGADATNVQVVINAFGDPGKTAKIDVNGTSKALLNGEENLRDYTWDITFSGSKLNAPMRDGTPQEAIVADGTDHYNYLPVYGNYFETAQKTQMIYSANMLSAAGITAGAKITSLTFYPYTGNGSYWDDAHGLNFSGGNVMVSLGTTNTTAFGSASFLTDNVTFAGQTGAVVANASATEWTISFTTPFTYNGGNLLVQIDTEAGNYSQTYFWGAYQSSNVGIYKYSSYNPSTTTFLPKAKFTYTTEGGGGDDPIIDPTVEGLVRIANLPIVDQFAVAIPDANNHPYRYSYYLKLADADSTSNTVRVPVQHTGAKIEGYYTEDEMDEDTNPENFLTENVISAQVDMTLSPTSAPYFYTINSMKGGVPADAWSNYLSVLQRREAGDYEEMQTRSLGVNNPFIGNHYDPGDFDMLDYRKLTSMTTDTFASYVPIVWTKGIARHYYAQDSLHNSYGAPIWKVKRGDVNIDATVQKQTSKSGGWNPSVNWYVKNDAGTDSTAYGLYFVGFTATGILPVNPGIEYEPYMFRVWLVDSTESLRNYTWEYNAQGKPIKIVDAGARPGKWFLLDEKQCNGVNDLIFQVDITNDYANNLQFAGPLYGFKPDVVARFYYKVIDQDAPVPSGLRGLNDDNNVGYVVLKGVRPDPSTAVHEIKIVGEIVSQTYYNVQGLESDRPFDGVNIVVTRFSDGSVSTTKVIK